MDRISPCYPLSHGAPCVDELSIASGIISVIRNGLRWCNVPEDYERPETIFDRTICWSRLGVFNAIFATLAARGGDPDQLTIYAIT